MKQRLINSIDIFILLLSLLSLVAAISLAAIYANNENPLSVPFLLRRDTYDKVLPFLLGTVAVGGFALAYDRIQRTRENALETRRIAKAKLQGRIKRLQEIYETVLACFQCIKLQRRFLRTSCIQKPDENTWQIRRGVFERMLTALNDAQIAGERVVKTLDFELYALKGEAICTDEEIARLIKLHDDLKSQIGGIQGILHNVLKSIEWKGVTRGTSSDEDLIDIPDGLIKFLDSRETGNLGFRKIGDYFDVFSTNIIHRIRELEAEAKLYSESE